MVLSWFSRNIPILVPEWLTPGAIWRHRSCKYWLRYWLVAWWHQVISLIIVDVSSIRYNDTHLRPILQVTSAIIINFFQNYLFKFSLKSHRGHFCQHRYNSMAEVPFDASMWCVGITWVDSLCQHNSLARSIERPFAHFCQGSTHVAAQCKHPIHPNEYAHEFVLYFVLIIS